MILIGPFERGLGESRDHIKEDQPGHAATPPLLGAKMKRKKSFNCSQRHTHEHMHAEPHRHVHLPQ